MDKKNEPIKPGFYLLIAMEVICIYGYTNHNLLIYKMR